MSVVHWLVVCAASGSVVLHVAAAKFHFATPLRTPRRSALVAICFLFAAGINLFVLTRSDLATIPSLVALAVYVGSLSLFAASIYVSRGRLLSIAFSPDEPAHLVAAGPYRYIRHPFYAAYCLTWVAGGIAANGAPLWLVAIGMCLVYTWAARFEERKFSASSMQKAYAVYRLKTGMFLPRLGARQPERPPASGSEAKIFHP